MEFTYLLNAALLLMILIFYFGLSHGGLEPILVRSKSLLFTVKAKLDQG
jgi:hypothetical protein